VRGLALAASFLTRVPVRVAIGEPGDLGRAVAWFPVVGAAVGAIVGGVAWAAALALPPLVAGLGAVAVSLLLTGAFHEDGLADTFDGLAGGMSPERRLEIMKDSRVGTFGATALVVAILAEAALLASFSGAVTVMVSAAAGAAGRAASVTLMRLFPAAAPGLGSEYLASVTPAGMVTAAALGAIPLAALGTAGVAAAVAAWLAAVVVGVWARRAIGGITGDVLGAAVVAAKLAVLVAAATAGVSPW
jgi:adenosylcobinamide-GDP ribazoletransferase